MKLTSEKVFDMLPYAVDIYEKLDFKGYAKTLDKKNKSVEDLGIGVVMYALKNSKKIKEEIFHIVAIAEGVTVKEAKSMNPLKTAEVFKAIFTDQDLLGFFKSAIG